MNETASFTGAVCSKPPVAPAGSNLPQYTPAATQTGAFFWPLVAPGGSDSVLLPAAAHFPGRPAGGEASGKGAAQNSHKRTGGPKTARIARGFVLTARFAQGKGVVA